MIRSLRILRGLTLVMVALAFLAPLYQAALLSVTSTLPRDGYAQGQVTLLNYANVLRNPILLTSLGNSALYVLCNVLLTLAVALPAAYGFSRYRFVGDRYVFLMLLAFRITPPIVLSLPVFLLFAQMHLLNSPFGIALVHCLFNVPIAIWILESFLSAVPRAFDETAFLDGYSPLRFFVTQLLPVIAPGVGVAAFFCFIFSWVEVVFARILTSTGGKPISMAIESLFGFQTDVGLVMAMTMISLLPGMVMIFFVRNHIAKGFVVR